MTTAAARDALVVAARAYDWNAARAAAHALIAAVPRDAALAAVRAELVQRLPGFEAHHPGVGWPRAYLEGAPGAALDVTHELPGPGGNSFASAVEALDDATGADDATCRARLVDALASAIMAELAGAWGARFPDRWRRWYADVTSGEAPTEPLALDHMRQWPETAAGFARAWSDVAARLAAARLAPE